jgi:hypothetical protein
MNNHNPLWTGNNQPSFPEYFAKIPNPQQFAQNILQQNPALASLLSSNNPRDMAYALAQKKGVPIEQINDIAKQISGGL